MGVYISNWKMPLTCTDCEIITRSSWTNETHCPFTGMYKHKDKRAINCPLIEVKAPHGRLVSASTLMRMAKQELSENTVGDIQWLLGHAPTIIESEDE